MKNRLYSLIILCYLKSAALGQTPVAIECDTNAACIALVNQAQQQSKTGQLSEAEKSYKLAYEVSHDARLLFNIARVLDKRAQREEAIRYYRLFIQAPLEDAEQKAKAREFLAKLDAKPSTLQTPPPVPSAAESPTSVAPSSPPTQLVSPPSSIAAVGVGEQSSRADPSSDRSVQPGDLSPVKMPQTPAAPVAKVEYVRSIPRGYSLGFGIPLLVGGTVMAGFGIGALSIRDQCAMPSASYWSVPSCGGTYSTLGPGIGLLVSGIVIGSGSIAILASPKSKQIKIQPSEKASP